MEVVGEGKRYSRLIAFIVANIANELPTHTHTKNVYLFQKTYSPIRSSSSSKKSLMSQWSTNLYSTFNSSLACIRHIFFNRRPKEVGSLLLFLFIFQGISVHSFPPLIRFGGRNISMYHVFAFWCECIINETRHGTQHNIPRRLYTNIPVSDHCLIITKKSLKENNDNLQPVERVVIPIE